MSFVTLTITDLGDTSVGINPCSWDVQCPFNRDDAQEFGKFFKEQMVAVYGEYAEGKVVGRYDFESDFDGM